MTRYVTALVVAGLAFLIYTTAAKGLDVVSIVIIAIAIAFGALGIQVARRAASGAVGPAECSDCGGLISPHSPYCKHCGAVR